MDYQPRGVVLAGVLATLLSACGGGGSGGSGLPGCGDEGAQLTALPVNLAEITGIVPLGNLNPPGHTLPSPHHYFYIVNSDGTGPTDSIPLYAPGEGWITRISSSTHLSADPVLTDYKVTFQPCAELEVYFGHVASLVPELEGEVTTENCEEYSTGGEDYRHCRTETKVAVTAGEMLGTAGGNPGQWALDVGSRDARTEPAAYANLERYRAHASHLLHAVSVAAAYPPDQADLLKARMGSYDGATSRTAAPVTGVVEQDEPGTLQGNWFREGADFWPEDSHLAVVHDNVDPTKGVVSIGTTFPGATGAHRFEPKGSGLVDREPSQVTADGSLYCYDLTSGAMLFRLTNPATLRAEYNDGGDCAVPGGFSDAAVTFLR